MSDNHAHEIIPRLMALGISYDDAHALRRISMTLHRWFELECGDSNDYASWVITRGRMERRKVDGKTVREFTHDEDGESFLERHLHSENHAHYERIPDRERGAKRRLAAIMARYPNLAPYIQGDPRGASLYICKPEDVRADQYTRGVAVYK